MAHQGRRWLAFGALAGLVVVGLTGCLFGGCPPLPGPPVEGLYAFGINEFGQLGLGDNVDRYIPERVLLLGRAVAVAGGASQSLVVLENGDVYACGWNAAGELGLGDNDDRNVPTLIEELPGRAVAVAAGTHHSLVVLENGDVYAFGSNQFGELGLGDNDDRNVPTLIEELPGQAVAVAAGFGYSLVVLENGDVYAFGRNLYGQLGLGDNVHRNTPTKVMLPDDAVAVAAKAEHSLVLLENGHVYGFGRNETSALGLGDYDNRNVPTLIEELPGRAVAVAAGMIHSLVLLEDGRVYAFGGNWFGQLGLGDDDNRNVPTLIEELPGRAVAVAAGTHHSLVLLQNGDLYAFGWNGYGQLGLGDTSFSEILPTKVPLPGLAAVVAAGYYQSLVIVR